ncbi:DUF349 domain-containing protein [Undibacterium baiyunense]|uniref:DUF349 domain-containing protein n=1 Tax=Undibacterium baiyunense TaxID=2828731 RepID=A0A941DLI6_9BURK|nr:DUF349 domain-containing protein [Undibacterium baiyunense]MBR7748332.1 DUF349 domain-containing protein [Undibacterium baiyunense]
MFEFLSKFIARKPTPSSTEPIALPTSLSKAAIEDKQKAKEQERQAYLQKIQTSIGNEDNLLALLAECDFADGRFLAAQHLSSSASLERALQITRNIDKRTAKLMQARLEQIHQQEQIEQSALKCLEKADALLEQSVILANQLIDLDKQFAAIAAQSGSESSLITDEISKNFKAKRDAIQQRLNAQLDLQRQLLQVSQEIDQTQDLSNDEIPTRIARWKLILQSAAESDLFASLPKHLLSDTDAKLNQLEQAVNRMRLAKVSNETSHFATPHQSSDEATTVAAIAHTSDDLKSEVKADSQSDLQVTNSVELHQINKAPEVTTQIPAMSLAQLEQNLEKLEAALEQGSLHIARQYERELRHIDIKQNKQKQGQPRLNTELKERLSTARSQFAHLVSWAKWSGNVSRDELVNTAEQLASLSLSPQEIVETVSALREQWRQMDLSGGAPRELWLRFDAACSNVYAPAAQHFQAQAVLRRANLANAEALLSQCRIDVQQHLNDLQNWKSLHAKILQMRQSWRKIGPVDRKEKNRLDKEFEELLLALTTPLDQRQQEEIQSREDMIAEVESLDFAQKSSMDQLRSIQQRWQTQAISVPLSRKDEQALWERFRAACDAIFEKKRSLAETADQQRQFNLQAKRAICAELTNANCQDPLQARQLIDSAMTKWRAIGHVPRALEQQLEQELQQQIQKLNTFIADWQARERQRKSEQFFVALDLCQLLEQLVLQNDDVSAQRDVLVTQWKALTLNMNKFVKALQTRFKFAQTVTSENAKDFEKVIQANASLWDEYCLHLEILLGIDSPTELARERLKKQVEVLQQAMKNGDHQQQLQQLLLSLLSLPTIQTEQRNARLKQLFEKIDHNLIA